MSLINRAIDGERARELAGKLHDHARRCKRDVSECATCQASIGWFASLPLDVLAVTLEERTHAWRRTDAAQS